MERSKGLILIVVGLAAALIVWQIGFSNSGTSTSSDEEQESSSSSTRRQVRTRINGTEGISAADAEAQPNAEENTRPSNQPGTDQRRANDNMNRTRGNINTNFAMASSNLKINIPENLESAQLRVLYDEYLEIVRNSGRGGRTSRGTRGGPGGGMMGGFGGDMGGMRGGFGGDMGGGMMGGFGGDMGGGMMGGFGGDMTEEDMQSMMEMMGGGMMGGRGGFGGMNMTGDPQMNIDEQDFQNGF